jgi:hypothetical protein
MLGSSVAIGRERYGLGPIGGALRQALSTARLASESAAVVAFASAGHASTRYTVRAGTRPTSPRATVNGRHRAHGLPPPVPEW